MSEFVDSLLALLIGCVLGTVLAAAIVGIAFLIIGPPVPIPTCAEGHFYSSRESACLTGYRTR